MWKRLLLILTLAALPVVALADDTDPAATPVPDATATPAAASSPAPDASGLGPQTSAPAGGSNADAAALQPAGSALQAAPSSSTGLTAPTDPLQAPASNDQQLRVLLGSEADGAPHQSDPADEQESPWPGLILGLFVLAVIIGTIIHRRQLRRAQALWPHHRPH